MSLLTTRLAAAAGLQPDKTAIQDCDGHSLTYAALDQRIRQVAQNLQAVGVMPGDRVALISRNSIDAIAAFWGILQRGAICVWLDEKRSAEELRDFVSHCDPALLLWGGPSPAPEFEPGSNSVRPAQTLSDLLSETAGVDDAGAPDEVTADDLAIIVYTSGSSGQPKGVCLTHNNLAAVADAVIEHMPITRDDSYLLLVPLHYIHGLMQLFVHAFACATIHLSAGFQFPGLISQQIKESGVSGFSGVPFHFIALIEHGGLLETDLPNLRWVTSTGGTLPPKIIKKFIAAFPDVEFHIAYGQTECAPRATALHPSKIAVKPNSVGAPIPGVQAQILDDDGIEVDAGDVGEIVISGPTVMPGYWRDPDGTARVLDELGRLHTRDLGHYDDDGDLYLDGRVSDVIKSAGERISSTQVEQILIESSYVADAVASSMADDVYGEILVGNVCLADSTRYSGLGEVVQDLHMRCASKNSLARSPRLYVLWREFPKLPNGKIDRKTVAAAASGPTIDDDGPVFIGRPGVTTKII